MILSGDIKLLKSDTMSDVPEGGGAITGAVIVDGQSNNIFDDISTLDRVYGAVHMRKVFPSVNTQNEDKYFGSHVIITKLPADTKIGVNLFNTGDWFDRRPTAAARVENYRAQGPNYNGYLWGTQYQGSRAITIFQSESALQPNIGDVLMIVSATGSQFIRIVKIEATLQDFNDAQGLYKRRILEIVISDVLSRDFIGAQMNRLDTIALDAKLFKTIIANAARYYSARPLALAAPIQSNSVKVDSVYSQVVPSSQAELALVDISAAGTAVPVLDAATGTVNFTTAINFSANSNLFLGSPCLPGSLSIPVTGGTLTDDGGNIKSGATIVGRIDYAQGIITFDADAPTYTGSKTVTFRPAAAPLRVAQTHSIRVTAANRGFVWTDNLNAPPKPKALRVSYRALNKWYDLHDNGAGGLIADEPGIGSGSINYVTGSVSVTTAAMPDADSDIIFSWGQPADFFNRANIAPGNIKIKYQVVQKGFTPSTLTITWNDGTARTITCNAAGVLSGYGTGTLNLVTGLLEFSPTTLPLGGSTFTVAYSYGAAITKSISSFNTTGNNVTVDVGDLNIQPGSLKVAWDAAWAANAADTAPVAAGVVKKEVSDNGSGAWADGSAGAINYANGTFTLNATTTTNYLAANFVRALQPPKITGTWEGGTPGFAAIDGNQGANFGNQGSGGSPSGLSIQLYSASTGYSNKTATTTVPAAFTVTYRIVAAGSSASETFTLSQAELDLTPGYAETIVSGSALFNFSGRQYVDRNGQLYYNIDRQTGSGTLGGTIDYSSGNCVLTSWASGQSAAVGLLALVTTMNFSPVEFAVMRTPAAPVKVGVFQIRATKADGGLITATANAQGHFLTADMDGFIEYETGVIRVRFGQLVTAAGNESQPWYDPTQVSGGQIFKPGYVLADTIFYNAVSYSYLPLSKDILGLDPVRLPADGRVPIYAPGDVVVVLNDQVTVGTYSNGNTTNLGRVRIAKLTVRDSANQPIAADKYDANLDTGVITWLNLSGVSQPLKITDRIEDMAVLNDVQITGQLGLSQPLTHAFPLNGTLVANAVIYGTLYARTSIPFDQQTWTNVWSDTLIGSSVAAQYNYVQYPIQVDNASCLQERWLVLFTSATLFNLIGEHVGQIVTGASIGTNLAPINPNTGTPYFTLLAAGWGSGWASGNALRFNTYGANAPTWIIEAIAQGPATSTDYTFCLEVRGDIDTP
jgi:hypothetical protein